MKGDYSRVTFDPKNNYASILMQQGRVQTDADFNEQFELTRHRMETEVKDFIGQSGVPEGNTGFKLTGKDGSLWIEAGRCYVQGILLENHRRILLTEQQDYPEEPLPNQDGVYLAYLDVWRRHLTALEAPNIRDAALGNQDTAARLKNLWQVRLLRLGNKELLLTSAQKARFEPGTGWTPAVETKKADDFPLSTGCLKAQIAGAGAHLGNQLYRIEVHKPGAAGTATFKWSRDNGSTAAQVTAISDKIIHIRSIGRGTEDGFKTDHRIEISNDKLELRGKPGVLATIGQIKEGALTLTMETKDEALWHEQIIGGGSTANPDRLARLHTRARQWDGAGSVKSGAWIKIENEIEVQFGAEGLAEPPYYKSGDYWLIPARSLMKNIYWERNASANPLYQPAYGTRHHYACLGVLARSKGSWDLLDDLRVPFKNLIAGLVSKTGDSISGDMKFEKSLMVAGSIGIGVTTPVSRLDINGDLTAEIIYARSIRAAKFEGGVEQVIQALEARIAKLEKKANI